MADEGWHILGAGAIGCLWASWLEARSTLILKEQHYHALAPSGTFHFTIEKQALLTHHSIKAQHCANSSPVTNLLICTKAHQTETAIASIDTSMVENIVLMQNGMGVEHILRQALPQANIYLATCTHGAFRRNARHIVHAGQGETYLGQSHDKQAGHTVENLQNMARSLSTKYETVKVDKDMEKRLWMKLAINCAINPLTAIHDCQNGQLLEKHELFEHLQRLCAEIDQVLHAKQMLATNSSCLDTVAQVARETGENFSSMHQDIHHERQSEIDFIQGYLLTQAKDLNISLPENLAIYQAIKTIEKNFQ